MLDYKKAGNYRPGKFDFERINSRVPSQTYKDNWDRIFGDKKDVPVFCRNCRELENKCQCGNYEPDYNNK